jgi:glutaredoxin-dependent peroxiredoxin
MTLQKGDKSPDFELASTKTETFKLSENLTGKGLLLVFYPFDWSPVCTNELGYLNVNYDGFKEFGVKLAAVSVDSPFSHAAWDKAQKLKFPLLSDFNKEVIEKFDVVMEDFHGLKKFAKRSIFLIDSNGIIQYAWASDDPGVEPDYDEMLEACKTMD